MTESVSFDEQTPLMSSLESRDESEPIATEDSVEPQRVASPEPPPYTETLEVKPTTPAQSTRYDKKGLPDFPKHVPIPIALFSLMPASIPPPPEGWIEFVHPEGQNYFYSPVRRIVTEANLRNFDKYQMILQGAGRIEGMLNAQNLTLPASTELLLELPDESEEPNTCRYYFIDHMRRTIFWLEHTATDRLDLPPVTSMIHLKHLMMQHYWNHIEFFPMHIAMPASVEEELVAILSHACIDFMTSDLSTVPYNQEQCETFIKVIQGMPESQRADGYRNCVMARLWSEISGNYFVNLHGETSARMSRNQRLLPEPDIQTPTYITLLNWVAFRSPSHYYERLCDLWVDKISYAAHWRVFMSAMLREWLQISKWLLLLLISAFAMFAVSFQLDAVASILVSGVQTASLISIVCCIVGICSTFLLLRLHQHHADAHASEAVDFLETAYHAQYGLQVLALTFALPWATLLWAFTSFSIGVIFFSFCIPHLAARIVLWIAIAVFAFMSYAFILFLKNGAASLAMLRIKNVLYSMSPWGLLGNGVDMGSSKLYMWLKKMRHGTTRSYLNTAAH